jgi:S-adenosylmethionine synthetase
MKNGILYTLINYFKNMNRSDYSKHKKTMRVIGMPMLIIGIILTIVGFISFASPHPDDPKVGVDSHKEFGEKMDRSANRHLTSMFMFGAGGLMIVFGFALVGTSAARPISKYYSTEMSPAMKIAAESIGEGLKESGAFGAGQKEIIKIKCPHCGYLESEDADFCSKCGKKI